jgi:Viral coat protein P2 N-terminal domain
VAKIQLEPFQNVSAAGTALLTTTRIWPNTLEYIAITLGGGVAPTKAQLSRVLVRLGSKPIWDVTGSEIASICLYEGRTATATVLILPFANWFARSIPEQYLGAIDFGQVGVRDMTFEITIAGGTTPTVSAIAEVAPPKVLDPQSNVLFRALLRTPLSPGAAATFAPQLINYGQAGGALLRRLFFFSALVTALEIKRDGLDIFEQIPLALNNAIQSEQFPHAPQANIFTYDVIEDDIESKALTTIRMDSKKAVSLIPQQILTSLSAGGTFDCVADVFANLNGL